MQNLISFITGLILCGCVWSFECEPKSEVQWHKISSGVEWATYDLKYTPYLKSHKTWQSLMSRAVTVRALKIDYKNVQLLFHRRSKQLSCNPNREKMIQKLLQDQNKNAVAAINANFYIMNDGDILGLAIDQFKIWSNKVENLNKSSQGILKIAVHGMELLSKEQFTTIYNSTPLTLLQKESILIIQAYPQLINDDKVVVSDQVREDKRSRTSIGQDAKTGHLLLVTIDAAGENSKTGMSLYEYAHMLGQDKCGLKQDIALNLDGGGSTAFAIPGLDLYKQADACRNLGNILTVIE